MPAQLTVAHEVPKRAISQTSGNAVQSISGIVKSLQTTLLGIVGKTVAADAPLLSAGLDSISGTELTNTLAQQFEIELPPTLMFDYPTIESMAGFIAEAMPTATLAGAPAEQSTPMNHLSAGVVELPASRLDTQVCLASRRIHFTLPGGCNDPLALQTLGLRASTANSHWPVSRLAAV